VPKKEFNFFKDLEKILSGKICPTGQNLPQLPVKISALGKIFLFAAPPKVSHSARLRRAD